MTRMRKNLCLLLALCLACAALGCKAKSEEKADGYENIVTINTADKFYCNGSMVEANVRELGYSGDDASVRIRFTNIGDDPIDGVDAQVRFLDSADQVLYTAELHEVFEAPLYKDESVSLNAIYGGEDASRIAAVSVSP